MKQTKLIILSTILFCTLIAVVFTSCEKSDFQYGPTTYYQPCEKVICLNGGSCLDGYCQCPLGFEGAQCSERSSNKFEGTYHSYDDCNTTTGQFYVSSIVGDNNDATRLILLNTSLFCSNFPVTAYLQKEKTSFTIPMQKACGDLYISGNGNLNNNILNVFIQARDTFQHTTSQCSIIMNKQ